MENLKHTKGQWAVMYSTSHHDYQTFEVAMKNPTFEQKEANAQLIEAAPDLLEALINLIETVENISIDGYYNDVVNKSLDIAVNAINKATK
jgi:hypothetical protein